MIDFEDEEKEEVADDSTEEDILKMKGKNPLAAEESVEEDDTGSD
jgi:hypothetical protein